MSEPDGPRAIHVRSAHRDQKAGRAVLALLIRHRLGERADEAGVNADVDHDAGRRENTYGLSDQLIEPVQIRVCEHGEHQPNRAARKREDLTVGLDYRKSPASHAELISAAVRPYDMETMADQGPGM